MDRSNGARPGPTFKALVMAMAGWAGLAACLTMVFQGMRAVMDVGGYCAEGGPYVIAQSCPEGSTAALLLGILGGLAFGFVASVGGFAVGGIWAATPILAWAALFGSLGWNFLEYGLLAPPEGGIVWGWLIPGIMFWVMAAFPLLGLLPPVRDAVGMPPPSGRPSGSRGPEPRAMPGPGQPPRGAGIAPAGARVVTASSPAPGTPEASREELARIAADFGAAIGAAMADVPVDPAARPAVTSATGAVVGGDAAPEGEPGAAFTEGTQALLDRLERLADMRDRGLLGPEEYETAKAAVMAELEGRS